MSTYPVLDNKPIDQWRVTELKEELKRRRLPVRGLKDDLIRRLDEALRAESETANDEIPAIDETESAKATDDVDETGKKNLETEKMSETVNESDNKNEETGDVRVESGNSKIELGDSDKIQADKDDDLVSHGKENVLEDSTVMEEESKMSVETTTVETAVTVSESVVNESGLISESVVNESGLIGESAVNETGLISESVVNETGLITESVVNETGLIGEDLKNETENKKEESELELKIEDPESSDVKNQVIEVSEVKSESIYNNTTTVTTTTTTSTNTIVSVDERNEQLKENIIADDVKLEFDVKPLSSENIIVDDGKLLVPMDSDDLQEEEKKKNEVDCGEGTGGDVGLAEKLNLERSSGEDSMEEDGLESKENNDSKLNSDERVKTGDGVNVDLSAEPEKKNVDFESKNESLVPDVKRKFNGGGQESGVNNDNINSESTKRQRRWNSGQNLNISTTTTNAAAMPKRNFSRSDSMASKEPHKERVVPPSSKPSTTSLRIDRFLRPFTLKAVQELLGKTGSVTSFWMDNIKTHCYVTYSSVEEAEETRNAVYNLQWPPNGGRFLVAEFVDPQEVKTRVEAPPPSPATPATAAPPLRPPPPPPAAAVPSPRLPMQRQQLPPPPSLPPPPPPPQLSLPPPPPLPERVEPPIVTLDDLFRKTKATPRIYYLPLSDEQVEHKAKMAQGKIGTAN